MLRNLESFWCPIKFQSGSKCANCKLDFPDIEKGWIPHDGSMEDVVRLLEEKYGNAEPNRWYGHKDRRRNVDAVREQTKLKEKEPS